MSNFLNWLVKALPEDEVETYLNMNNIHVEKADLCLDVSTSLHKIIVDTYLGDFIYTASSIDYSDEDIDNHFDWCWGKMIKNFNEEGIFIKEVGDHKEYFKSFFIDSFYKQKSDNVRDSINGFFVSIFNISAARTKADLDILNELYKMINNNISYKND